MPFWTLLSLLSMPKVSAANFALTEFCKAFCNQAAVLLSRVLLRVLRRLRLQVLRCCLNQTLKILRASAAQPARHSLECIFCQMTRL